MHARTPLYRRQRSKDGPDRAFVVFAGKRYYLGIYGTPESKAEYGRLIAEARVAGGGEPLPDAPDLLIGELAFRYFQHVKAYYQRPGKKRSSEVSNHKLALRILRKLYKRTPVREFGPRKLKAVRGEMIERGWSRGVINKMIGRVRRAFKWGVDNEIVPGPVLMALQAVEGLKAGRSEAREGAGRRPVQQAHVDAVLPFLPSPVAALVRLQLLTAARGGELLGLRATDLDRSGSVWTCKLVEHKTAYLGHARELMFGAQAQAVLKPLIDSRPVGGFLFSPVAAEKERRARCKTHRRQDQKPNETKTARTIGERYTSDSYRRCIARACAKAGVPVWSPHQLRHAALTNIKKVMGLDKTRAYAGHEVASMTAEYSREADRTAALEVAKKLG
ncbi:MAG: site-specific integrase [Planctomycetes bacterium]|nr:site-specific integrase [Planctomycetota bacterium]